MMPVLIISKNNLIHSIVILGKCDCAG